MSIHGSTLLETAGRTFQLLVVTYLLMLGSAAADVAVNTYTSGDQNRPTIAADGEGRFIIVWVSQDQDGDGSGVFGRRFDAKGQPLGDEFAINEYTTGNQARPRVSADTAGNFIVVWQGPGGASRDDVFGRRFGPDGVPLDGQFQINEDTSLNQRSPDVALDDDGDFLTVWSNEERLVARHFDDLSAPTVSDFDIAVDDTYGNYAFRSFHWRNVEALPNGRFVIVWHDHFYAGYNYSYSDTIQGAILNESNPVSTFSPSSASPAEQDRGSALATTASGDFLVVWGGYSNYASESRILGRRYASSGAPLGPVFDSTPAGETFLDPEAVATVGEDRFLVVWNQPEIEGQLIDLDGVPVSAPFAVNSDPTGFDRYPMVASSGTDVMVTWMNDDGGLAMDEVVASITKPAFQDGFESGDTTAWSTTVP